MSNPPNNMLDVMKNMYHGIRVIPTINAMTSETVDRTKKERWWSWPWKPWKKTKIVARPAMYLVKADSTIYCHPSLYRRVMYAIENDRSL